MDGISVRTQTPDAVQKPRIVTLGGMCCNERCFEPAFCAPFLRRGHIISGLTLPFHQERVRDSRLAKLGITHYNNLLIPKLNEFCKEDGQGSIFVGFSMGGLQGQLIAGSEKMEKPFQALVAMSSASPYGMLRVKWELFKVAIPHFLLYGLWKRPFIFHEEAFCRVMLPAQSAAEKKRIYESLVYESGLAMVELIGFLTRARFRATKVDFQKIRMPTLLTFGELDQAISKQPTELIHKKIVNSTLAVLKNQDHWAPGGQYAGETAETIIAWLERNGI